MIRYLSRNEKSKSRELWEEAFSEDSKEFTDYYFDEKLKNNCILVKEQNNRIISMAHLNPYRLFVRGRVWNIDYIVGVATDKKMRHQGHMRTVLSKMFVDMHTSKMPFCFLMPADEKIYRPFDFTFIFNQPEWKLIDNTGLSAEELDTNNIGDCIDFSNSWLSKRYEVYSIRDFLYFENLLKEVRCEAGSIKLLYDISGGNKSLAGILSVWGLEKQVQRELICDNKYTKLKDEAKPAIMARIINAAEFVKVISLKEECEEDSIVVPVRIEDSFLEENNNTFLWHLNKETSYLEKIREPLEPCFCISISKMTEWLFGYADIDFNGFSWCSKIRSIKGVFLDEVV